MEGLKVRRGKQFSKMFIAQVKLTFREKQAWFWGIFFPIILMIIFMLIFADDESEFAAKVAVVEEQPNRVSQMMLEQIRQMPVFEIASGGPVSLEHAKAWVNDKEVAAAVVLPESEEAGPLLLIVNKENERSMTTQAVSGILDKLIQQANLIAAGTTPTYELRIEAISSGNENLKYRDFLLTGMIALSIAQGGLFGMVDLVEMRRRGLIKRLRMTPASMGLFGLSDMIMRMIFGLIQLIALSLIGVFFFGATLQINFISLAMVFLIGALSFNAIGFLISSFSKTAEAYMGMANIASFLMMFLSGIFFPVETMPSWLQPVSAFLPLTYFADGLRDGMAYAAGPASGELWLSLGIMGLWGALAFALGSWLYQARSIAAAR